MAKTITKKRGRPKMEGTERFQVRAHIGCVKHWRACAKALGITLNAWVNLTLNAGSGRAHKVPTQ
jgi:predicted HicB family RNase H-like nuclease